MIYDEDNDIFISKRPYPSWTLNTSTATWDPPVAKPSLTTEQQAQKDAGTHWFEINWNESTQSWDVVNTAV
jgi:hypothetical protein